MNPDDNDLTQNTPDPQDQIVDESVNVNSNDDQPLEGPVVAPISSDVSDDQLTSEDTNYSQPVAQYQPSEEPLNLDNISDQITDSPPTDLLAEDIDDNQTMNQEVSNPISTDAYSQTDSRIDQRDSLNDTGQLSEATGNQFEIDQNQGPSMTDNQQNSDPSTILQNISKPSLSAPAMDPQPVTRASLETPIIPLAEKENIYTEICSQIIQEQEKIIGALAVEQASQVEGLTLDPVSYRCVVVGDGSKVINDLIEQYRDFFGHAAVEVCKEAASKYLNKLSLDSTPELLR